MPNKREVLLNPLYAQDKLTVAEPVASAYNSYAHYGEMCGYATNTQGDVWVSTSTELRGCAGKHQH